MNSEGSRNEYCACATGGKTSKMAEGVERMVSAALSAIQNEQKAGRDRNPMTFSDDDDFTEGIPHRSANLYRETVKHFSPNGRYFL